MRIAMLGHKRIPSREGGVEVVVEELAVRMAALGHDVTCYNRSGHHISGKEFDVKMKRYHKGVRVKMVPALNIKGIAAMTASFLATICAAFGRFDVVHFHTEGSCVIIWLPKLLGKRCIVTVHGLDHLRSKWGRFARAYILLGEKCAVKFADEIIVLSRNMQSYFKDIYGKDTRLIPNGTWAAEPASAKEIAKAYSLEKDNYILYLGRMTPEKGVHYLIEAYHALKTDKKLVLAGGTSDSAAYYESLKQQAGGNPNILFTGFVQGEGLKELYSNASVYVLPSEVEGMPLSLLEAMGYGCCCLVSDIAECTEVIKDAGVTFCRGNTRDLQIKLQQLCDDPHSREQYGKLAVQHIHEHYSWDDVVKHTLFLYGEKNK